MTRPTTPQKLRVNNHLQLHLVSSRGVAGRRAITRQKSHRNSSKTQSQQRIAGDQERIDMLKKKMTTKNKTTKPPPILLRSSRITEIDDGPKTEKTNTRAHRRICPSFLKRRGSSSSKGMQLNRGGGKANKKNSNEGLRTTTMGNAGRKNDDDTEIDSDSDSGITEYGVFTRFFGGDDASRGSLETKSVSTYEEEDDIFWYSLHSMCGNCA